MTPVRGAEAPSELLSTSSGVAKGSIRHVSPRPRSAGPWSARCNQARAACPDHLDRIVGIRRIDDGEEICQFGLTAINSIRPKAHGGSEDTKMLKDVGASGLN
jgi:hypothetical protein